MTNGGLDLLDALEHIEPSALNYQQWCDVGMALKHEGFSADVWERWSARDAGRYHAGECLKKWQSFNGSRNPVTGGTLVQMAMDHGWKPADRDGEIGWDDTIGGRADDLKVVNSAWLEEKDLPKAPEHMDGAAELIRYLQILFTSDENVGYVTESYETNDGRRVPTKGNYDRTAGQLIQALNKCKGDVGSVLGDYDPATGAWIRFNPLDGKGVKNENVTEYRYALVESDTMDLTRQYSLMLELQLPIAVMVHSGKKSIHAIVRIDAQNYDEYRQRVDYLYSVCQKNGMELDRQNRNPSRLSRMPGVMRNGKPQYILAENVGCESFAAWTEYIESVNDNLPEMDNLAGIVGNFPELAPELIKGVLRHGHKMLLSGPSKAGKSFALIELTIAIAEGLEWMGFKCDAGSVLYINLELDRASCLNRFRDVYKAIGRNFENAGNIDIWNIRGRSCPMDKLTPKLIRRAQKKKYAAIILDPIYKVITGDENSADQMATFCNQFDKICTELGCAFIYCHHHSKGSQGQKKSMDRASGSGVFARDPDALLDMIELDVPQSALDAEINRKKAEACRRWADKWMYRWTEKLLPQDTGDHMKMLALCRSSGSIRLNELEEQVKDVERLVEQRTAWRIESVLREFPPIRPKYVWFDYPVHVADDGGKLREMAADGEKHGSAYKAQAARKDKAKAEKLSKKDQIRNALALANGGGPVTTKELAEYFGIKPNTAGIWVRENGFFIDRQDGNAIKEIPAGPQSDKVTE